MDSGAGFRWWGRLHFQRQFWREFLLFSVMTRDQFKQIIVVPTRWADTDYFGHVNNVKFARYIECGRVEYFVNVVQMELGPGRPDGVIIANLNLSFRCQIYHPQSLEIGTRVVRLGNSSIAIESAIFMEDQEEPAGHAEETLVWFNYRENRSQRIPDSARQRMIEFEGEHLLVQA